MKLQINLASVILNANGVQVYSRPASPGERAHAALATLPPGYAVYFSAGTFFAWTISQGAAAAAPPWKLGTIQTTENPGLFVRLIESGITQLLQSKGFDLVRRKIPKLVDTSTNLLDGQLATPLDRRVGIYPTYTIEATYKKNADNSVQLQVLMGPRTQWRLSIPVSELLAQGINCTGLGVRLHNQHTDPAMQHLVGTLVGNVSQVNGASVHVSDPRDPKITQFPSNQLTPEGTRQAIQRYINGKHRTVQASLWTEFLNVDAQKSKPKELLRRVRDFAKILAAQPIPLANGLTAKVGGLSTPTAAGYDITTAKMSEFVFDYASKTRDDIQYRGLRKFGPYDKSGAQNKKPTFIVLCPKNHLDTTRAFFKSFTNGAQYYDRTRAYNDYPGFAKLFHLDGITWEKIEFDTSTSTSLAHAYQNALTQALPNHKDATLCFVVTEEAHKNLSPAEGPYFIAKALLLQHGIPVSALTVDDMRRDGGANVFVLRNVALQTYAKMGGTPFVLKAPVENKLELILGIGRADVGASRFGRKRVVGFATVFKNNGDYLVGSVRPFKDADNYAAEFSEVIAESLQEAINREGVHAGTPIRLIFHIYKQAGKGKEITAVETALKKFSAYPTEFALVHVSDTHSWLVVDEDDREGIAPRGQIIKLTPYTRLVNIFGPREYLKKGTPTPLKISLDKRSNYRDIDRLTQQVYDFTSVSWRGFNVVIRPVTIRYAELAAEMGGKLEQTAHWQPTMLQTFLKDKKWFL